MPKRWQKNLLRYNYICIICSLWRGYIECKDDSGKEDEISDMILVWKWHDETFSNYNIVLLYIRTRRDPSNKKGKNKTAWVFVENETKKWDAPRTVSKQNPPLLLRPTERDPKKHGKRARRQNPQIYDVNSHHSTPPTKSQLGRPQHSWRLLLPRCLICAHHPKHPIPARSALARG